MILKIAGKGARMPIKHLIDNYNTITEIKDITKSWHQPSAKIPPPNITQTNLTNLEKNKKQKSTKFQL